MEICLSIVKKGTVKIKFSNGFGNNLFQYCFGRLIAEYHGLNYSHPAIPELGIREEKYSYNKKLRTIKFKARSNAEAKKYDENHLKWFSKEYKDCNFDFYTFMFYFEDYEIYKPNLSQIKLWFPLIKKNNTKDLVLHFRLSNRLVWETHYKNFVKPDVFKQIIKSNFDFDRLYIVGDMEKWDYVTEKDIRKIQDDTVKKYKKNFTGFIPVKKSLNYMNALVDNFKEFKPKLRHSENFIDDFNFIRSFDQIMFKNSTFAWWAAVLSNASKVGAFGPWKPGKGKRNKNLGQANFPGWFSWGAISDLINKIEA